YLVKVAGVPDEAGLEKIRRGLSISTETKFLAPKVPRDNARTGTGARTPKSPVNGSRTRRVKTAPAKVRLIREGDNPWYELMLTEGRNRQIRRMFEEIGHHVEKIRRVRYGPLSLDVPPGEFRRLSTGEIEKLKAATGLTKKPT